MTETVLPRFIALLGFGVLPCLVASGCTWHPVSASETVKESFDAPPNPQVVANTFNGEIKVTAGDEGKVRVVVVKSCTGHDQQEATADLANIEVSLRAEDGVVRLTSRRSVMSNTADQSRVSMNLVVPATTALRLSNSNGPITVRGVQGGIRADTSNGPISIHDSAGTFRVETSNAPIELAVYDAQIEAATSNGAIRVAGSLARGVQNLATSNGLIDLTLPADAAFTLDAAAPNGRIVSEFPLDPAPHEAVSAWRATVGEHPATEIVAQTTNSEILIHRAKADSAADGPAARPTGR